MRKTVFILVIFAGIALGAYLGICYPPEVLLNGVTATKEAMSETASVDFPPAITPAATTQPTAIPSDPTPFQENPILPEIVPVVETSGSSAPYNANGILGHLIVNGNSVMIRDSIDEDTLSKGPAWMPDSALPGADGMSVILGHRNRKHLKLIENVKVGDTVSFRFVSDNRLVTYTVTDVQIFEKTADWTLPVTDENILVLVTCYPFSYTGSAPGKFMVVCRRQ